MEPNRAMQIDPLVPRGEDAPEGRAPPRHHLELYALVVVCARSGFPKLTIAPETRETLAGLDDPLARVLKSVVDGCVPRIPPDLPAGVGRVLEDPPRRFERAPRGEPEGEWAPSGEDG
jgi:hypothetical protein